MDQELRIATEEVQDILDSESIELGAGDYEGLSDDIQDTASSIVTTVSSGFSQISTDSPFFYELHHIYGPTVLYSTEVSQMGRSFDSTEVSQTVRSFDMTEVSQTVRSFFTLCYIKTMLFSFLRRRCCLPCMCRDVSLEEVMELSSPLSLDQELRVATEEVQDILERGDYEGLSDDTQDTASSIVTTVLSGFSQIRTDSPFFYELYYIYGPTALYSTEVSQKVRYFFTFCCIKTMFCSFLRRLCCLPCTCGDVSLEEVIEQASPLPMDQQLRISIEEVQDILEREAIDLGAGDYEGLSDDIQDTASSIVTTVSSGFSQIRTDSPFFYELHFIYESRALYSSEVSQTVRSFFTLCYIKTMFRSFLRRLCCLPCTCRDVSLDEVMEKVSPLLKQLIQKGTESSERDFYMRLSQDIADGEYRELSEELREILSTHMAPTKRYKEFRREVHSEMKSFMESLRRLLQNQQQLTSLKDSVQRVLVKISTLVFRRSRPPRDTPRCRSKCSVDTPICVSPEIYSELHLQSLGCIRDMSNLNMRRIPTSVRQDVLGPREQLHRWNMNHCNGLVYEVVSRVFQKQKGPEVTALARDLLQQLKPVIAQWEVKVKPDIQHFEDVAQAVYRDLCRGNSKSYMSQAAQVQPGFTSQVLQTIYKHLTTPEEKKGILGSFLRSFCSVFNGGR